MRMEPLDHPMTHMIIRYPITQRPIRSSLWEMTTPRRSNGDVADADAARAIERDMAAMRERVQRGGVMEYLKPHGPGSRKDVNKMFLSSTIRSVDSHNRRHEEDKCWKIRELERKLDDRGHRRRARSRSRSSSPTRRYRSGDRSHRRSRSRSRSRGRDRDHRRSRRSRSRSRSNGISDGQNQSSSRPGSAKDPHESEREYWAAKKAEKTTKMWENVYAGTTSVMVENAPEFSSDEESDDEDERVPKTTSDHEKTKSKKEKKAKKHKKAKKPKRS